MPGDLEASIQATADKVFKSATLDVEEKKALFDLYGQIARRLPEFWACRNINTASKCMIVMMQLLQSSNTEDALTWSTSVFKLVYAATTRESSENEAEELLLNSLLICTSKPEVVEELVRSAMWSLLAEEYGDEAYDNEALEEHVDVGAAYGADQMLLANIWKKAELADENPTVKARYEAVVKAVTEQQYGDTGAAFDLTHMIIAGDAAHEALGTYINQEIELFGIYMS